VTFGFGVSFPRFGIVGGGSAPPVTTFIVLDSAGTSYSVTRNVLDSLGVSYTVGGTVLASNGTAYNPI
jgi:hypothetical protein